MDWSRALFEVIELRSFSNIWYWMAVAVTWSSVSYFVLGVPYDFIQRARRLGGEVEQDLNDLVRVNVNRLLHLGQSSGLVLTTVASFILTGLFILAFYYWVELAQAIFLIALPLSIVGILSLSSAQKIANKDLQGEDLYAALFRHRLWTQIIGMVAIFFTAMFGMYQNLDVIRFL